jgi:hypothetical protein
VKALLVLFLLAVSVQAQQPVAVSLDRDAAVRFLNGACVPPLTEARTDNSVTVIVQDRSNEAELTAALILALGIVPPSRVVEIDEAIPEGFQHLDTIEHNSHPPFRPQRLVGPIVPVVRFCK